MAIESKNLLVAVKAFSRGNALPLDASSVQESLSAAQTYAKAANAYAGQVITALVNNKYQAYVLQPGESGYTLEKVGVDASEVKQYVIIGTRPESGQQQGTIYIDNNVGYIWNGSAYVKVFEDVSTSIEDFKTRIGKLETNIELKAPLNSPSFTGTVKVEGNEVATQTYVNSLIGQLNTGVPGIVSTTSPLPTTGYKAGQTWRVSEDGTYAGIKCEVGDLIICLNSYSESFKNDDFMAVQANIDGAVTGPDAATDGHIVIFDGATGKIIKDSNVTIASLSDAISKAHEHANKEVLDSFDKTQEQILSTAASTADEKVTALKSELTTVIDKKANSEDVYTRTDIDSKLETINSNLNTKLDSSAVDEKITTAKEAITGEYTQAISTAIGDIGEEANVKAYVDKVVGSGGADVAQQIATAKSEAITESKKYTDTSLTITEF